MESITQILKFINDNWFLIVAAIAIVSVASIKIYRWFKQPSATQIRQIQEWLLYAVAKAEKELGSGTGEMKLRYVYDMFVTKFPAIAIFIDFDDFSMMVEQALEKLEELIKENADIGALVSKEDQ
ncbi:MAG TPA: hypothetical protein DCL29_02230 [Eubacterium sp.]|nr:hypothetical protein [Eubacterium sp.]